MKLSQAAIDTFNDLMKEGILGGVDLDTAGICLGCGAEHDGCEPDASRYECEECGEHLVEGFGNVALLMF